MNLQKIALQKHWFTAGYALVIVIVAAMAIFQVDLWRFSPDSGIYIGTAYEMLENHRYWFNGYPNLQYYPGTSTLAALLIALPTQDFLTLNIYLILQTAAIFYLYTRYFRRNEYGIAAIAGLVLLASNGLTLHHAFVYHSDGLFLMLVLAAFLMWRRYTDTDQSIDRNLTLLIIAASTMVRIEGILLLAGFGLADLLNGWKQRSLLSSMFRTGIAGLIGFSPFLIWTLRNYLVHTPHAFNTLNERFFDQDSAQLYASGSMLVEGEPTWWIPLHGLILMMDGFLDKVISVRLGEFIPPTVAAFVFIALVCLGFRKWIGRASVMEITFVGLVLVLLFYLQFSKSPERIIIPRYWTPILPSLLLMMASGALRLIELTKTRLLKNAMSAILCGILLIGVAHGAVTIRYYHQSVDRYGNGLQAMQMAATLVERDSRPDDLVGVTDFGVMPSLLDRKTVKTLNDESHMYTLHLIKRYQAQHLIIVDRLGVHAAPQASKMVTEFPHIFRQLAAFPTGEDRYSTRVYKIDQQRLAELPISLPGRSR